MNQLHHDAVVDMFQEALSPEELNAFDLVRRAHDNPAEARRIAREIDAGRINIPGTYHQSILAAAGEAPADGES